MEHLTSAVRQAVAQENWHAALGMALTLPDICGSLEGKKRGRSRYVEWCRTHLEPRYSAPVGAAGEDHLFLRGEDCYALRCAVLHEGSHDVDAKSVEHAVKSFRFIAPKPGWTVHNNSVDDQRQLQVDIFSEDICSGVDAWWKEMQEVEHPAVQRASRLMTIEKLGDTFTL